MRTGTRLSLLAVAAATLLGGALYLALDGAPTPAAAQAPPEEAGSPVTGAQIWQQDCAVCHGPEGRGSFQGPAIDRSGTAAVDFMVRTGRMPLAFRGELAGEPADRDQPGTASYTDGQIRDLVAYTAGFVEGPEAVESVDVAGADVAAGGELYRLDCAACHQLAGSGGALAYGTNGPPLTGSAPAEVVEAMRVGPGSMPVFPRSQVSDEEATQIAAYVDYLHDPVDRGGAALWHIGPVGEGLVAWVFGVGGIVLVCLWLGQRSRVRTD